VIPHTRSWLYVDEEQESSGMYFLPIEDTRDELFKS